MAAEGAGRDIAMVICAVVDESFFFRFDCLVTGANQEAAAFPDGD